MLPVALEPPPPLKNPAYAPALLHPLARPMCDVPTEMVKEMAVLKYENTKKFSLAPLAHIRYCIPDVRFQTIPFSLLHNISCNIRY